jgi:hypothetical protein
MSAPVAPTSLGLVLSDVNTVGLGTVGGVLPPDGGGGVGGVDALEVDEASLIDRLLFFVFGGDDGVALVLRVG